MSLLKLKNTTLLFVETRAHKITQRVIDDCISKADFGDIVVFTDKPAQFNIPGARIIPCIDFPNKRDAGAFYYSEAMKAVETDFALMLEWDAGIFDATKWLPEFFDYDYIGAPWVVRPGEEYDVGNGGFTLMSRKLGHKLCESRRQVPVYTDMDVSRLARRHLEPLGFKWPKRDLASCFAWELGPRNPEHFGFHGAFTWPVTLPEDEMFARARLMLETDYLTVKLAALVRREPRIIAEFSDEERDRYLSVVPMNHVLRPRIPGVMSPQQRAAMLLMQAQRRGFISHAQKSNQTGLKA
jgi:hypothetical protein